MWKYYLFFKYYFFGRPVPPVVKVAHPEPPLVAQSEIIAFRPPVNVDDIDDTWEAQRKYHAQFAKEKKILEAVEKRDACALLMEEKDQIENGPQGLEPYRRAIREQLKEIHEQAKIVNKEYSLRMTHLNRKKLDLKISWQLTTSLREDIQSTRST